MFRASCLAGVGAAPGRRQTPSRPFREKTPAAACFGVKMIDYETEKGIVLIAIYVWFLSAVSISNINKN